MDELPRMEGMAATHWTRDRTGKGWVLRLTTTASLENVHLFYLDEMPRKGWTLRDVDTSDVEAPGERVLCFAKGRRVCIISVEQKDSYTCVVNAAVF